MRSKDGRKLPEEEDVRENFLAPAFTTGARTAESWHTNAARQSMHGEPFQFKKFRLIATEWEKSLYVVKQRCAEYRRGTWASSKSTRIEILAVTLTWTLKSKNRNSCCKSPMATREEKITGKTQDDMEKNAMPGRGNCPYNTR
ncbi:hypothetical protein CDAR_423151 [Caerostris darwini]|uniref:Uncharacterized protein n=1 Tax=Caerostris darwini TaxID=1538125 RepID=A0AAV4URR6_9ARAC|nr:hypothetical protein CDAR_423151 [Caerostris darwini]